MSANISSILESGEEVVWQATISRALIGFSTLGLFIPVLAVGGYFLTQNVVGFGNCQPGVAIGGCVGPDTNLYANGALSGGIVLVVGLVLLLANYFLQRTKEYIVTSKRVIIRSGLFRTNYQSIYFDKIRSVVIGPRLLGKIFGFGTIKIDTGKMTTWKVQSGGRRILYDSLPGIEKPDEVYQYINSAVALKTPDSNVIVNLPQPVVTDKRGLFLGKVILICISIILALVLLWLFGQELSL